MKKNLPTSGNKEYGAEDNDDSCYYDLLMIRRTEADQVKNSFSSLKARKSYHIVVYPYEDLIFFQTSLEMRVPQCLSTLSSLHPPYSQRQIQLGQKILSSKAFSKNRLVKIDKFYKTLIEEPSLNMQHSHPYRGETSYPLNQQEKTQEDTGFINCLGKMQICMWYNGLGMLYAEPESPTDL